MDKIVISGGKPLCGDVEISGMKNAALPIIFASILTKGKCTIKNLPLISDVEIALEILRRMGAEIRYLDGSIVTIDTKNFKCGNAPDDLVAKMRASSYLIGAELGRFGRSDIAYPGGCNFGDRPLDQHEKGFRALGADVHIDCNRITATTANGIHSGSVYFDITSVGATINIMMAAVLTDGLTTIENAACEPHIVDLAGFFNTCGADITGAGTPHIKIHGGKPLHGDEYEIIPDMIEAGTFMTAAAATGGDITIRNIIPKHLESITSKLTEMGADIEEFDECIKVSAKGKKLSPSQIRTKPYPGFPTDMHPQFSALMCLVSGESDVYETVFRDRFRYVDELRKMGAEIELGDGYAHITGKGLHGAEVNAVDLRAGAAMIVAGLAAEGKTVVSNVDFIRRGYHDIVGKFRSLGADIEEISE